MAQRASKRDVKLVQRCQCLGPHDHDDPRLHDRDLRNDARDALRVGHRGVGQRALHAQRPVNGQRIDRQPLEGLHQRATRASVEGNALLDLGGQRCVLEQHDVRLGMARAEHRHQLATRAVRAALQLARQRVQLPDRPLEVLLADLVICSGHRRGRIRRRAVLSLRVHRYLRRAGGLDSCLRALMRCSDQVHCSSSLGAAPALPRRVTSRLRCPELPVARAGRGWHAWRTRASPSSAGTSAPAHR